MEFINSWFMLPYRLWLSFMMWIGSTYDEMLNNKLFLHGGGPYYYLVLAVMVTVLTWFVVSFGGVVIAHDSKKRSDKLIGFIIVLSCVWLAASAIFLPSLSTQKEYIAKTYHRTEHVTKSKTVYKNNLDVDIKQTTQSFMVTKGNAVSKVDYDNLVVTYVDSKGNDITDTVEKYLDVAKLTDKTYVAGKITSAKLQAINVTMTVHSNDMIIKQFDKLTVTKEISDSDLKDLQKQADDLKDVKSLTSAND